MTRLLELVNRGEAGASDRLFGIVHAELRRLARHAMRGERRGHTLQPTALVNEAYMRLAQGAQDWESRAHFFGAAAEAMRRVLVEHARRRAAAKRGADQRRVTLQDVAGNTDEPDLDVLDLDRALDALAEADGELARLVKLRYFVGLTVEESAGVLGRSEATVKRDWTYARAWLHERMR